MVLAADGYPGTPTLGGAIAGPLLDGRDGDVHLVHAGTRLEGDVLVASGGRVLGAVARGGNLDAARAAAYAAISDLDAPSLFHRRDIAERAAQGLIERPSL